MFFLLLLPLRSLTNGLGKQIRERTNFLLEEEEEQSLSKESRSSLFIVPDNNELVYVVTSDAKTISIWACTEFGNVWERLSKSEFHSIQPIYYKKVEFSSRCHLNFIDSIIYFGDTIIYLGDLSLVFSRRHYQLITTY